MVRLQTLFGSGLGPDIGVQPTITGAGVPNSAGGTQVTVDGTPVPVLYAQDTQVNFLTPQQSAADTAEVCVVRAVERACVVTRLHPTSPAVFRIGTGLAITNQDGTPNSPQNPAESRSIVSIYGAGFGPYDRSFADGAITDLPLANLVLPVSARFHDPREACRGIGGGCILFPTAEGIVHFAGAAPFAVSGLTQLNIGLPEFAASGGSRLDISVVGGGTSVTVYVKKPAGN